MNLFGALEGSYPYWVGVYCVRWKDTGAGSGDEQPITSVIRRAPKGVRLLRIKWRLGLGGNWVREGGSSK